MPAPAKPNRPHLATLVADMERWGARSVAVVEHRGVRRFATNYAELASAARRFAAELDARGIPAGERVVLWGANSATWMSVFFGCVLRGVLVVPLDLTGTAAFTERILRETTPRLIVGERVLLRKLGPHGFAQLALEDLPKSIAAHGHAAASTTLSRDTPLQILFTSGTTGEPKGVVHTHRNLLASIGPIEQEIAKYKRYERLVHPLRFLHTLPLSHVFGQFMGLWVPPLLGATVHYEQRGTASHLAELIPRERIHVLAAVPRTLALLRSHLLAEHPDLQAAIEAAQGEPIARRWWRFRRMHRALGLRFWAAVCGGATLQPALEQFWTTMGFALVQGYGLTETAALVTLNHPFKPSRGSLGSPLPGRELRLGATGELEVKGDMVAGASWQHGRLTPRESPWLPTGDLASLGDDGRVSFLGRTGQRLVTAAGLNVYLQDVEQTLEDQDGLNAAVVFAMPGLNGGEEPAAVVLVRGGAMAAATAIAEANQGLAPHQQVRRWWLWPGFDLPRTATGKVKRGVVEQWARMQAISSGSGDGAGSRDAVVDLLAGITGNHGPVGDNARLDEDWGLDSMGRVALAAALEEQLGLVVTDGVASGLRTLGDLRGLVRGDERKNKSFDLPQAGASEAAGQNIQNIQASGAATTRPRQSPLQSGSHFAETGDTASRTSARGVGAHYPTWPWTWPVAGLRILFVEFFLRPMVAVMAAPRVKSLPSSAAEPLLIVANHRTAMDVPLLLFALPFQMRRKVAVAMSGEMLAGWKGSWSRRKMPPPAEEHRRWWGPVAALLLHTLLNVFPLPRTSGFRRGFAHAGRALDRGYSILIFPEGRRTSADASLSFKPGLGILAAAAYAPVQPVALWITEGATQRWWRSRPVVSIGASVAVDRTQSPENVTATLQAAVETLLAECKVAP